jgi:uncharacterized protein with FMN-binding domain
MKKLILSFSVIVVFAFYAILSTSRATNQLATEPVSTTVSTEPLASASATPAPPAQAPSTTPTPSTPTTSGQHPLGTFKDGSYTGSVEDVYYGNVQVKATVASGKLSNVVFLQYPNDRNTSVRIAQMAMPVLKSEAIRAQSANVNIVSGATQTSQGFQKSLASALAQATN